MGTIHEMSAKGLLNTGGSWSLHGTALFFRGIRVVMYTKTISVKETNSLENQKLTQN